MKSSSKTRLIESESSEQLCSRDIYNFYYLEYLLGTSPQTFKTQYGNEILNSTLKELKDKYLNLFKDILYKQLIKYIYRGRIDSDFNKNEVKPNMSTSSMVTCMKKTFRSDMKRRNELWNDVAVCINKLDSTHSTKDIFLSINWLNMCIHNTKTKIITDPYKVKNANALLVAFDAVHNVKNEFGWRKLLQFVSTDIKNLNDQNMDDEI